MRPHKFSLQMKEKLSSTVMLPNLECCRSCIMNGSRREERLPPCLLWQQMPKSHTVEKWCPKFIKIGSFHLCQKFLSKLVPSRCTLRTDNQALSRLKTYSRDEGMKTRLHLDFALLLYGNRTSSAIQAWQD